MDCRCASRVGRLSGFRRPVVVGTRPSRCLVTRTFASEGSRQPWDIGRFVKTVLFFNDPLNNILKTFTKSTPTEQGKAEVVERPTGITRIFGPMESTNSPVALFGSATEIGKDILEGMTRRGMFIRSVVSDVQSAQSDFEKIEQSPESTLEVVDSTKEGSMTSVFVDTMAVVVCGPFSPYHMGVKNVICPEKEVYDPSDGVERIQWGPLDDVVMGGCSQSQLTIQKGKGDIKDYAAVFSGNITSANNGGFASVRTKNFEPAMDLTGYDGLNLKLRGDGQRYKFMLRTSTDWDGVSFCQSFDTKEGWQNVKLPFNRFFPVFRAKSVTPAPPLDLNSICSMQVMLSKFEYDGDLNPSVRMGRFELPIEGITAIKDDSKIPRLVLIGGSEDDQEAVKKMTEKYVIVNASSEQEVPVKDSTFVEFCLACMTEEGVLNATYEEKTRETPSADLTVDKLFDYFTKK